MASPEFDSVQFECRTYIKIRSKVGETPKKIHDTLVALYGYDTISYATVKRWAQRFRDGRQAIGDDYRAGRPISASTIENIAEIYRLVKQDARLTLNEIATYVGISSSIVFDILHHNLRLRKLCALWIPHFLTESQKVARVHFAKEMLKRYSSADRRRLYEICTGDKTWVHFTNLQGRSTISNG